MTAEQTPVPDIKDAILTRQFDLKGGGHVTIYVWQPTPFAPYDDYACRYLITGLWDEPKVHRCHGIDGVQALELTLQTIGVRLYFSDAYKNQELTFLGSRNLSLPVFPGEKAGSSEYKQADLLTFASQSSVVVMPDQKFPYIAYPGERLKGLIDGLTKIAVTLRTGDPKARKSMTRMIKGLTKEQKYYEAVCKRAGLHPSYIVTEVDKPDDES